MKAINFVINEVENVVENAKVSAAFVQELKEAFSMSCLLYTSDAADEL